MGVSTDGQLSYGVVFEEGFEFPWDSEDFGGDIDAWWESVNGFVNPVEYPFTKEGDYKPGMNDKSPQIAEYFAETRKWAREHPIPVELVNYCSGDYSMYIVATKHISNSRGSTEVIKLEDLLSNQWLWEFTLLEFLTKYNIEHDKKPAWHLSSYWG